MSGPAAVALFVVILAAVFAGAFGVGRAIGPVDAGTPTTTTVGPAPATSGPTHTTHG